MELFADANVEIADARSAAILNIPRGTPGELISRMRKTIHVEVISRAVDHLVGAQRAAGVPAEIGTLAPISQAIAIFPNCKRLPSLERDETINLPAAHQSVHNPAHRVTESLPAPTFAGTVSVSLRARLIRTWRNDPRAGGRNQSFRPFAGLQHQ